MTPSSTDTQCAIKNWVKHALADKNLEHLNIEISSGLSGDGFLGDIVFAKVSAERGGKKKQYELVLKFGKDSEQLRESMPVSEVYEQEIFMYNEVFPSFNKFLKEKGQDALDFIPRCRQTENKVGSELLVLDNLKALGYELHDKTTSMNVEHIEEVLKVYGRWHSISFAMQDQKYEEYSKLTAQLKDVLTSFMEKDDVRSGLQNAGDKLRTALKEINEHELLKRFDKVVEKGIAETFNSVISEKPDKTIISHGDCWNNNFMFKYQGENRDRPDKVAVLDWQISYKRSPVIDLSYFLYAVSSKKELDQLDRLLKVYHTSLSENIAKLGSDPTKLFTLEELLDHWKKYSIWGFINSIMVLPFALCERDDAPKLEAVSTENNFGVMIKNLDIKNKNEFNRRMYGIVDNYVNYNNIV